MNLRLKRLLGLDKPKRLVATLVILTGVHFAFPRYLVETHSMDPTIRAGDYVIASRLHLWFRSPKVGQIEVIPPAEGISPKPWVHRLIGAAGEDLASMSGRFPAVTKRDVLEATHTAANPPTTIPTGYFYQSGDGIGS